MATLSLYVFNLLPLPFLDGTQLLDAVLDFVFGASVSAYSADAVDLEALEGGRSVRRDGRRRGGHGRLKFWIGKMTRSGAVGLCVGCVGLGVVNWMVGG